MASIDLYPPILDTYMPAFIIAEDRDKISGECVIHFSLSKYNQDNQIGLVCISITNQYTNESVLNTPTGLKAVPLEAANSGIYTVRIPAANIKEGWRINEIYKVQLRFTDTDISNTSLNISNIENKMDFIISNSDHFSEWSTVCLVQGILQPVLSLNDFVEGNAGAETTFTSFENVIAGKLITYDQEELESYQFQIYKENFPEKVEYDSGLIYSNPYQVNEINAPLLYGFVDGEKYILKFTYYTKNLYTETEIFNFIILDETGEALEATIQATADNYLGCVKIHVESTVERFFGNLTIRRTSNKSNFTLWEDVHTTAITSEGFLNYDWHDYTVESGVWYKYCVQKRSRNGDRGLVVRDPEPVMVILDDMFLSGGGRHLRIKFNPQISSYQRVVSETSTQTIGGKYPFITRNGNLNYRQFSISGLISYFMDDEDLFTNKDELYENQTSLYNTYNEDNQISPYRDFILEKKFRDKVEAFLCDGKVKLFRSTPEGTALVRLMNISLNPEPTLGRMLYSFSATAYEIDEVNITNLLKYNIYQVGAVQDVLIDTYDKFTQVRLTGRNTSLVGALQEKENSASMTGLQKEVLHIKKLDLQFDGDPYILYIPNNINDKILTYDNGESEYSRMLGFLITVKLENNYEKQIVIGTNGSYHLEGEDLKILDVIIDTGAYNSNSAVFCSCVFAGQESAIHTQGPPAQIRYYQRAGQVRGVYRPQDEIGQEIYYKYKSELATGYQKLYSLNKITLEGPVGAAFYIKDTLDTMHHQYVLGPTGTLTLESDNSVFEGISIAGVKLVQRNILIDNGVPNSATTIADYEWIENTEHPQPYETVSQILNPQKNNVYKVKSLEGIQEGYLREANLSISNDYIFNLMQWVAPQKHIQDNSDYWEVIYYKENWYIIAVTDSVDTLMRTVICPVDITIDYEFELEQGEYK